MAEKLKDITVLTTPKANRKLARIHLAIHDKDIAPHAFKIGLTMKDVTNLANSLLKALKTLEDYDVRMSVVDELKGYADDIAYALNSIQDLDEEEIIAGSKLEEFKGDIETYSRDFTDAFERL